MNRRKFIKTSSLFLSTLALPQVQQLQNSNSISTIPFITKTIENNKVISFSCQKDCTIANSLIYKIKNQFKNCEFISFPEETTRISISYGQIYKNINQQKKTIIFCEKKSNLDLGENTNVCVISDVVFDLNVNQLTIVKSRIGRFGETLKLKCSGSLMKSGFDYYYFTNVEEEK